MSHLSPTNLNQFALPQLSVQPMLSQDPAGKQISKSFRTCTDQR